jgi:Amt family ammonium transporter
MGLSEVSAGEQFGIQVTGVVSTLVWSGIASFILIKIVSALVGLRVHQDDEVEGLDLTTHGERGYDL